MVERFQYFFPISIPKSRINGFLAVVIIHRKGAVFRSHPITVTKQLVYYIPHAKGVHDILRKTLKLEFTLT